MLTAMVIAFILLLASAIIFSFAAMALLGKILVYAVIAFAIGYLIKWIFD